MHNFSRPETLTVAVERETCPGLCPGLCPECNSDNIAIYRVLSEGGWWDVTKCQSCLFSLKRDKGPLLGPITPFVSGQE